MSIAITWSPNNSWPTRWRAQCTECDYHRSAPVTLEDPPRWLPHIHRRADGAYVETDGEHERVLSRN